MFPLGVSLPYRFDPLEALRRWPADRPVVMLHSGRLDLRWSRYSIIAEPVAALTHRDGCSAWVGLPRVGGPPLTHDPFADLDAAVAHDTALYVGHLNYDLARTIEHLPDTNRDDHGWPELQFQHCPNFLVHDHLDGSWRAIGLTPAALPDLSQTPPTTPHPGPGLSDFRFHASRPKPEQPRADHQAAVQRGLDYIAAGDVFQVNLAHRFAADFTGSTRGVFLRLASESPAWYGAYLELLEPDGRPPCRIACSTSPELFLQLDTSGHVTTRPIKGTRPAAADPSELLTSEKDTAELNMIIDLLRNDLGRVCTYGSVAVTQTRTIETHPTVHHGVATVEGKLHHSRKLRHLMRAMFPGGSVTGAPKVRAMQIIEELEPVRRGPYCGAIGWVQHQTAPADRPGRSAEKNIAPAAQFNLAIRTLLIDRDQHQVHFSVGGGIVADSIPADEYEETLHKAAALIRALCNPS